mmetsp:Transcript_56149/g.126573  ORF Transcript_56149/g.126573 Transcript_56149/m.126573 type:complete len:239 (-) Transcript_56149:7-723(-)
MSGHPYQTNMPKAVRQSSASSTTSSTFPARRLYTFQRGEPMSLWAPARCHSISCWRNHCRFSFPRTLEPPDEATRAASRSNEGRLPPPLRLPTAPSSRSARITELAVRWWQALLSAASTTSPSSAALKLKIFTAEGIVGWASRCRATTCALTRVSQALRPVAMRREACVPSGGQVTGTWLSGAGSPESALRSSNASAACCSKEPPRLPARHLSKSAWAVSARGTTGRELSGKAPKIGS